MAPCPLQRVLLPVIALVLAASAASQTLPESSAALGSLNVLVVPETRPVGIPPPAAAATAAAISPQAAATTVRLRRTTRVQAAAALRRARPWRPMMEAANSSSSSSSGAPVGSQAICGGNSLVADNRVTNCRIVTTYGNGQATSCSAFKIGINLLGTAGHCLYSKPHGGWASSIDVYCTGSVTCNVQRTTYATHITTTPSWMSSVTTIPTAWDGAAIRTASALPGPTLKLAQFSKPGSYQVTLTGYPAQSGDPGCSTNAFAGACYQYSSTDVLQADSSGMYSSGSLDLCSGHSGSGVTTPDASSYIVAVVSGASFDPCANYFVPQINSDGASTVTWLTVRRPATV